MSPPEVKVYIMTLGVLAPYRRLGIARSLISNLLTHLSPGSEVTLEDPTAPAPKAPVAAAKSPPSKAAAAPTPPRPTKKYRVGSVYLHVQTSNEEAREFYKKQGFEEGETLPEYYRKGVEPRSAVLLERKA